MTNDIKNINKNSNNDCIDADIIYELEKECFSNPWSLKSLKNHFSSPNAVCVIRKLNGKTAGYALGVALDGECELYRIGVLPAYKRQGLGCLVLTDFLNECGKNQTGECRVFLEVRSKNTAAVSLYKNAGFTETARRANYYADDSDDALIFEIILK